MKDFSVLMSVYHKETPEYLEEALQSIFYQTSLPNEVVLIKDGPLTKELDDIIESYQKKYPIFKIICNETNIGLGLSLQKGVLACKNEIIARMDTDDIIPPDRFKKELSYIYQGYDVVSCNASIFLDTRDNLIATRIYPEHDEDIKKFAHKRSPLCHAASMFRRSAVLAAGNYQDRFQYEDYHLWVRMILNDCNFYNIQEVLYFIRTTPQQLQRRGGWKFLKKEIVIFKEFRKLGFYTMVDLIQNTIIRFVARLTPMFLREWVFKIIWNKQ